MRAGISAIELAFPELAESEDEKIKKGLIELIENWNYPQELFTTKQNIIAYLERLKEQKPAEWSEDDEYLLDETVQHLEELIRIDRERHCGVNVQYYQRDIDWLKDLHPPKDCSGCAKHLEGYISGRSDAENKLLEQFGALITPEDELHIKPRWKPSEEQLNYVNWAYSIAVAENDTKAIEVLGELHDTLLNLMQ